TNVFVALGKTHLKLNPSMQKKHFSNQFKATVKQWQRNPRPFIIYFKICIDITEAAMIFYLLLFLGFVSFLWAYFWDPANSNSKLPPKVPGALPIFGHLLTLGDFPCKVLLNWKKKYGPVYLVKFGSFR
ncbi:unnamed protein product, partial [Allacma fusca]